MAKRKSLPQHWHISSKGNMNIPSTNSRKHTCFLFFISILFLNIYSSFSQFLIVSRAIRNSKTNQSHILPCEKMSEEFNCYVKVKETETKGKKDLTVQFRADRWNQLCCEDFISIIFFLIQFLTSNISGMHWQPRHQHLFVVSEDHEITRRFSTNPATPGPRLPF